MYPIPLTKSTPVSTHMIGSYRVVILTDCQGIGAIQFAHAALVYSSDSPSPIFAVASEVNRMEKVLKRGRGSHFLCSYDDAHHNYESSDDWADLEKFTQEALSLITKHFLGSTDNHSQASEADRLRKRISEYKYALRTMNSKTDTDKYGLTYFELGEAYSNSLIIETKGDEPIFGSMIAYEAAVRYLSRDMHPNEYLDALLSIARNYRLFGINDDTQESWIKARDAYQKAIAELLKPDVKEHRNLALSSSYESLGDIFQNLKQIDNALREWHLAHQTYQQHGHNNQAESVAKKIAKHSTQP